MLVELTLPESSAGFVSADGADAGHRGDPLEQLAVERTACRFSS